MNRLLADEVVVAAPPERLWSLLDDVNALKRILPGCEELVEEAPGLYRAVMRTKLSFLTLRVAGTARLADIRRPDHFRIEIQGRPMGLVGSFTVSVPVDVLSTDDAGTRGSYAVDMQLTGRLASFGAPILKAQVKSQVREMIGNLERELAGSDGPAQEADAIA
ncbi:MAG: SRPBCC family protein [Chloroflexi bacterium]|nr:SRPBCC family protein [Chloroflexota bacterium]